MKNIFANVVLSFGFQLFLSASWLHYS